MNVIIAGKNNIAVSVCEYIRKIYPNVNLYCVFNETDNGVDSFQRSYRKFADDNAISGITLSQAYDMENSIFLSLEFDKIVKPDKFKTDCIYNIHFSLLPRYKGMYTSCWPILNNEKSSGVTLHKIDSGIDTGDIIEQVQFNLDVNETAKSLYFKYIDIGTKLVISNMDAILKRKVIHRPQSNINSTYYSKSSLDYSDLKIDYKKTAFEIKNQINAFTFRDYQLVTFRSTPIFGVKITSCKSRRRAGELIEETKLYFKISTIDFDCIIYKDMFDEMLQACEEGDFDSVKMLSLNPSLINEKNEKGWSPIIVSSFFGHLAIVEYLLGLGANINDVNNNGTSVLMYAKDYLESSGDIEFIDKLMFWGADKELKDNMGLTVKDYVIKSKNKFSLEYFG